MDFRFIEKGCVTCVYIKAYRFVAATIHQSHLSINGSNPNT